MVKNSRVIFEDRKEKLTKEEMASFKDNYHFKVIAELKDDLTEEERAFAKGKIEGFKNQLKVVNIDDMTYCKKQPINGAYDDFGAVTLFYCTLSDIKSYFSRLEWHDLWGGRKRVAV